MVSETSGAISNTPAFELQGSQKKKRRIKRNLWEIFEEIIVENFPNMEKEIVSQVQSVPYRINPRRNTPGHILIKLTETKHKERILKAAREKQQVNTREIPYT